MNTDNLSLTVSRDTYIVAKIKSQEVYSGIISDINAATREITIKTVLEEITIIIDDVEAVEIPITTEESQTAERATDTGDNPLPAQNRQTFPVVSYRLHNKSKEWIAVPCGILSSDKVEEKFVLSDQDADFYLYSDSGSQPVVNFGLGSAGKPHSY
jgi:hypothetical protein